MSAIKVEKYKEAWVLSVWWSL